MFFCWQNLWEKFIDQPINGIGFCSVRLVDEIAIEHAKRTGHAESGSSWLGVLSMTGILGGSSVIIILISTIHSLQKVILLDRLRGSYLVGILIFFIMHMCAEGYIFSAGSMAFFIFWLLIGTIQAESMKTQDIYLTE